MRVLALEYHDVYKGNDPDWSGFRGSGPASYKLSLCAFEEHLAAMAERRLTVERTIEWCATDRQDRSLFITFDDGGCGAMLAAESLEIRGWRGHFFVTAGRVGTPGFLSAHQLADLSARGHVIGTHSMSHPKMMGMLPRNEILTEWRTSRQLLEDSLGAPVVSGSVPGGFYKPHVGETAAEAGLTMLFTSNPTASVSHVGQCALLGRYTVRRGTSAATAAGLAAGAVAPRVAQTMLYGGLGIVRSLLGNQYTRLRDWFWLSRLQ